MRYHIASLFLLSIATIQCVSASWPATLKAGDFFLYNKRRKPVYYAVSVGSAEPNEFNRINPQRCSPYIQVGLKKEVHVYIALDREPKKGDKIDHYIFQPGMFQFIHLKVMSEPADVEEIVRLADRQKEIIRDGYVVHMHTNYNPTVTASTRAYRGSKSSYVVEEVTYTGDREQDRKEQLKAMTVDQLEEQLATIATLLGVLHARKNNDCQEACKQLEQEREWIRSLLAAHYMR